MHVKEPEPHLCRPTGMRTLGVLVLPLFMASCTGSPHGAIGASTTVRRPAPAASSTLARTHSCPPFIDPSTGGYAAVEYTDFLEAQGRQYIAGLDHDVTISTAALGAQVLEVNCSYSALNDSTGQVPAGPARDGDAAFLSPGTPVYAVQGWSTSCRLAATLNAELHVYLAYQPNTQVAKPAACALQRGRW